MLVAGRPLGGLLFSIGAIFPFLADMISFIYSVAILLGIKDSKQAKRIDWARPVAWHAKKA